MVSNNISEFTQKQINSINTEVCNACEPETETKLCHANYTGIDNDIGDKKCEEQCSTNYNADSYYYDKNGTKRCYCGNTKAKCKKYNELYLDLNYCDVNSKNECILRKGKEVIGADGEKHPVNEPINNEEKCQKECNKILRSDGLYCSNQCICTNPSFDAINKKDSKIIEDIIRKAYVDSTRYFCPGSAIPILQPGDDNTNIPDNYFEYGKLLRDEGDQAYAFCGCDRSVIEFYNTAFHDCPKKPTLASIWDRAVQAVKKKGNNKSNVEKKSELYSTFNDELMKQVKKDGIIDLNKLKALVAFEMCRITNDKYSRIKDDCAMSPGEDPGGWLKCKLSNSTSSGKFLNGCFTALVILMLLHIFFRTLLPTGGVKNSLLYALFMPDKFLQGSPHKLPIISLLIITMILLIFNFYLFGNKANLPIGFGFFTIFTIIIFNFCIFKNKYILKIGIPGFIGLLLIPLIIGFVKNKGDNAGDIIKYFFPDFNSLNGIFGSGLAFSLYAIILGAGMMKFSSIRKFFTKGIGLFIFYTISIIVYYVVSYAKGFKENENFGDKLKNGLWLGYSLILFISIIFNIFGCLEINEYVIPFILITVFGILPFVVSSILLNFAIAWFSPGVELLFLVLYRISGYFSVRNIAGGSLLLAIFGKRSTDKWVMPFLPIISNLVKVYYKISGDDLPGYFTDSGVSTGVRNTEMWLS